MTSVTQLLVNNEKHSGAVEVFQNPSSNSIANFAVGTGFNTVKTQAVGEGTVSYDAGGHYVIRPQLFPQVACHVIFEDGKIQISNQSPFGEIHIKIDGSTFILENEHDADLHVKRSPPAGLGSAAASDTKYLGTFADADTIKKGEKKTYPSDGHYAFRSTLESNPANFCGLDFVNDKIHMSNTNPAGEISIVLQA